MLSNKPRQYNIQTMFFKKKKKKEKKRKIKTTETIIKVIFLN